MKLLSDSSFGWGLAFTVTAAIFALVIIGLSASPETATGQRIIVMSVLLGIFLTTVLMGTGATMIASERPSGQEVGWFIDKPTVHWLDGDLELVDEVPSVQILPVTVGVAGATGGCPLGFRPGQSWGIDADGHISRPLCRPAVDALSELLPTLTRDDWEHGIPCRCPMGDREVVFAVEARGLGVHVAGIFG